MMMRVDIFDFKYHIWWKYSMVQTCLLIVVNLIAWDKYTKLFFNQQKTTKKIGDEYEANLLIELVENGIEANMTKTSIRKGDETIYISDGGIDIFGNYLNMNYIMQAKYRTDDRVYVSPKDVRKFAAILMQQYKDFLYLMLNIQKEHKITLIIQKWE